MLLVGHMQKVKKVNEVLLKVENLSKIYRSGIAAGGVTTAVDNANFEIKPAEIVALVGESGSGKTTLGKLILRLIKPSLGKIIYNGIDISKLKGRRLVEYYRHVQGVFQDPFSSFNPIFKVDRVFDLIFDSYLKEMKQKKRELIANALEKVMLNPDDVFGKYPHQMSGGQLQRILIARTLLLDTKLLIADEIISMLDASVRVDVLNTLGKLKDENKISVIFVTHDLSLGYYISDTTMIMYKGNIVEMGDTEKVYSNPLHPYTRMLLSVVPTVDRKWEKKKEEELFSLFESGKRRIWNGCPYYDRCPLAMEVCQKKPSLLEIESGHKVACYAAIQSKGSKAEKTFSSENEK